MLYSEGFWPSVLVEALPVEVLTVLVAAPIWCVMNESFTRLDARRVVSFEMCPEFEGQLPIFLPDSYSGALSWSSSQRSWQPAPPDAELRS